MADYSPQKRSLGVCYYPEQWDESRWSSDLAEMAQLGIRHVRVAEFAWSRMEPVQGSFDFAWLRRFLDLAHDAGLSVVVGTPTACPPKWLVDAMPDLLALDKNGLTRNFGSRRHYCFSHEGYRAECQHIVRQLAEAVGNHPAVGYWQTDNEFGCHNTVLSYSVAARDRFRRWLRNRYGDIDSLNKAWGNVFWSMEYQNFDAVELPIRTPTDPNPSHLLDFHRFSSDMVREFQAPQVEIIRRLSPGRPITHNFMGGFTDFDHYALGNDLDFVSWDSYPLGFLASFPQFSREHRREFLRAGDPDFVAFHHDLYRTCGRGRWWVMEQQPGPVNWADYNPAPQPGMVRLWTLEAMAHGAEVVSYFRWRQVPYAQEQYHAGLHLPDGQPDVACAEIRQLIQELPLFDDATTPRAEVAVVYDYEAVWVTTIQPQAEDFSYLGEALRCYRALRQLGLNVDIVPPGGDLSSYRLVLVPSLPTVSPAMVEQVRRCSGLVLFGPRLGSKTESFHIPGNLPPGAMQELLPLKVQRVDSLPADVPVTVQWNGATYSAHTWIEQVASELTPLAHYDDGHGALFRQDRCLYYTGLPDERWLGDLVKSLAVEQRLAIQELPAGVRSRRCGQLHCYFNYNAHPVTLSPPVGAEIVLGGVELPPAGVLGCRESNG